MMKKVLESTETQKKLDIAFGSAVIDFYNGFLEFNIENKILHRLPMSKSHNFVGTFGKLGLGLMSLAILTMGIVAIVPYKTMDYVPKTGVKYVPAQVQDKYLDESQQEFDDMDKMLDELDQLQTEVNLIDSELSAVAQEQ